MTTTTAKLLRQAAERTAAAAMTAWPSTSALCYVCRKRINHRQAVYFIQPKTLARLSDEMVDTRPVCPACFKNELHQSTLSTQRVHSARERVRRNPGPRAQRRRNERRREKRRVPLLVRPSAVSTRRSSKIPMCADVSVRPRLCRERGRKESPGQGSTDQRDVYPGVWGIPRARAACVTTPPHSAADSSRVEVAGAATPTTRTR